MRVIIAGRLSRKAEDRDQTGFDSQEREAVRWAEQQGHEVVAVVADYKTGRSGLEARPNLKPWVTEDGLLAQYDGVLALKVDRLTRGNREETSKLEDWARQHHKSLLIASQGVKFPSEGTEGIAWDLYLRMAHAEWLEISERYRRMQRNRREVGSVVGKPPWGYRIERRDGLKAFVPTEAGREYIPRIYGRVIEGWSALRVARWLDSEGAPNSNGRWHQNFVNSLVRNPVYRGERRNGGALVTEALVDSGTWETAVAALSSRAKPGRGAREKALLRPYCMACYGTPREGCPSGQSPMYKVVSGPARGKYPYYRCTGSGPQRTSCGAPLIPLEMLDDVVTRWHERHPQPWMLRTFHPGRSVADELATLNRQISEAVTALDYATVARLSAEAEALKGAEDVKPHWTSEPSGITRGQHFRSLDRESRREFIADEGIILAMLTDEGLRVTELYDDEGSLVRTDIC